jgi:FkbM family methyltransferase
MTFISYAQNFEDIMLWRALKHVENGFYIDVGANDPVADSVTNAFYSHGWCGINIEPLSSYHAALQRERPRDISLRCAAGAICGEIELWDCEIRGWATADKSVIAYHEENGHIGSFQKVPILPLSEICNVNVEGEIHFLKIDVEGFEKSVIEGMDFSRFRPWILVIEATRPNSVEEVYGEWEDIVLSNNYLLAYTDGLNRFYVASEHSELLNEFRYPPNVFDEFIRVEQLNSERRAQQAEEKAQTAEEKAQTAEEKAQTAEEKAQAAEARTHDLINSSSWRITRPLRRLMGYLNKIRNTSN